MTEIKQRLRNSHNWLSIIEDLEQEAQQLDDKLEQSRQLFSVGVLCEELFLRKDKAMENYQKAFKLNPSDAVPLVHAQQIYREMGNLAMVAKLMEFQTKLVEDPSERAALLVQLANIAIDLGRTDEAQDYLQQAQEQEAASPQVQELQELLNYGPEGWQEHVSDLLVRAEAVQDADHGAAARLVLSAARVLSIEASGDAYQEELLRKVLEIEPENSEANFLLERLLLEEDRSEEILQLHHERLAMIPDEQRGTLLCELGSLWAVRFNDLPSASTFYIQALQALYQGEGQGFAGHVAAFRLLKESLESYGGEWGPLLSLADEGLEAQLDDDDLCLLAMEAADIAWRKMEDLATAAQYFKLVKVIDPTVDMLNEFSSEHLTLLQDGLDSQELAEAAEEFERTGDTDLGIKVPGEDSEDDHHEYHLEYEVEHGEEAEAAEEEEEAEPEPEPEAEAEPEPEPEAAPVPENVQPAADFQAGRRTGQEAGPSQADTDIEAEAEPVIEEATEVEVAIPVEELEPEPVEEEEPEPEAAEVEEEPEAAPVPEPEDLDEETAKLFAQAEAAEAESSEKGIDAWRKAAQKAQQSRVPRRALVRLYTVLERWNALVEVIKEEVELVQGAGEKIGLLQQMVDVYRDKLGLDVMVVSGLNQILTVDPSREDVLDELAVQYEKMKRWTDLISTLKKKTEVVAEADQQVDIWLRVADLFVERFSNQAEAIKAYERVIDLAPAHGEALDKLKQMYERRRDWEKLIGIYQREIDQLEDAEERKARTIEVAELATTKLKRPLVSQELWSKVLALDPENLQALQQLETLYERSKDWDNLAEVCQQQVDLTDDAKRQAQLLQKLALMFSDKLQDSERAIVAWKALLELEPNNRRALDTLKKLYIAAHDFDSLEAFYSSQNKWDEYIRVLERQAASEEPAAQIQLHFKIADLWQVKLDKPDRAARAYEKVLTIDADNLGAAEALIQIYESGRDVRKFMRVLEIQLNHTEDTELKLDRLRQLAELAEERMRDKEQALSMMLRAVEADPRSELVRGEAERLAAEAGTWPVLVEAYDKVQSGMSEPLDRLPLMLTVARVQEEELLAIEEALAMNQAILQLDPANNVVMEALVRLYTRTNKYEELLEVFHRKIEMVEDDEERREVYLRMATIYDEEMGDVDKAINAFRMVLDVAGEDRQALQALDRLYESAQMWTDLSETLIRQNNILANEEPQKVIELKFRLGMLYEAQLEDIAGAVECYRDILDLQMDHEGARAALEKLLADDDHKLEAAQILQPIYDEQRDWPHLAEVFEIQLSQESDPAARVEFLLRIGNLWVDQMGDGARAFDAYSRCFTEDPSNETAREELERLAEIQESWEDLAQLFKKATDEALDGPLQFDLLMRQAIIIDEKLGEPERAVEFYQRAQELDPDNPSSLVALEKLYSRSEKWTELLEVFNRQVDLTSDAAEREELFFRIATLWEEKENNLDQAVSTYQEILSQDGTNVRALEALDRLYEAQENWVGLADNLSRQLEITGGDAGETIPLLLRLAGLREQELAEVEAAIEIYQNVLELDEMNVQAVMALEKLSDKEQYQLAVAQILEPIYKRSGDWQALIRVTEIMVSHSYDPAEKLQLLLSIGELYEVGDDPQQAFGAYGRALREDPSDGESMSRLEKLARILETWPGLVSLLEELVADVMDEALVIALQMKVATIYQQQMGDLEQAAEAYKRVLAVNPQQMDAISALEQIYMRAENHQDLVSVLIKRAELINQADERKSLLFRAAQIYEDLLENPDKAIEVFQMVLDVDDTDALAIETLERLYSSLSRWEDLKDLFIHKADLLDDVDDKKAVLFNLGSVLQEQLGDLDQAVEAYTSILDLDPQDFSTLEALAALYQQGERWDDLLQILERQVELAGGTTADAIAIKYNIGALYQHRLNDLARAVESYREVLSTDPTHETTHQALEGIAHGEQEAELAAQVLEPIYESSMEWEKLVDICEVMVTHAEDQYRRVELLQRVAALYEQRMDDSAKAFEAHSRAFKLESSDEQTMEHLERLAEHIQGFEQLAGLYEVELENVLDADRQILMGLKVARIYEEELYRADAAIEKHQKVLEMEVDNVQAVKALDRLYLATEQWELLAGILRQEMGLVDTAEDILELQFRLGQLYQDQLGDPGNAVECYRDILAGSPEHSPSITSLELLLGEGQHELEIAEILEPLYRTGSQWDRLVSVMEVRLGQQEDVFDKVQTIQQIVEICEQRMGDHAQAFGWCGKAFAMDPFSEVVSQEAERLARIVDGWGELVSTYAGVLESVGPDDRKGVLKLMARVYEEELFDNDRAEEAYLSVLQIDEMDAVALSALDRIYTNSETYEALAAILQRRIAITDSTDELVALQLRLGQTFDTGLHNPESAIEVYTNVLDAESRNRSALDALERLYFATEKWGALFDIYERMLDVAEGDDGMAECYARMAKISSDALGDSARSRDLWSRVLDLRGEDLVALWALADLNESAGEWNELVEVLERQVNIAEAAEDKIRLYKRLGRIWGTKLNRDRDSLETWQKVLQLDAGDTEALYAIIEIYHNSQAWEELGQTLHRLIDLGTAMEMPDNDLADLYTRLGELEGEIIIRPQEAIDAWRKTLEFRPGDPKALNSLEILLTHEQRWEECIQVLMSKAETLSDQAEKIEVMVQAAVMWRDKENNNPGAARIYEQIVEIEEGNETAISALKEIYHDEASWEPLIELLLGHADYVEDPSRRAVLLGEVARVYEEHLGSPEQAFVVLQAAFKEDYTNDTTAQNFERLASATGRWNDLLAEYREVVETITDQQVKADLLVKMGRWYGTELDHMDWAIAALKQALQINPECLPAMDVLETFYRKDALWSDLVKVINQHVVLAPETEKQVELLLSLGELYESQLQDSDRAITAYNKALQKDEVNADALQSLERLYRQSEQWEALVEIVGRRADAAEDEEQVVAFKQRIGQIYSSQMDQPQRAIESYKQVLDIEPRNSVALTALAGLYEQTDKAEELIDILEQQLDIAPSPDDQITLYKRMARVWEEKFRKLDRAAECLEKVLDIAADNAATYQELERLYREDGRFEELVDVLRRHIGAVSDPQEKVDLFMVLGETYETSLKDPDQAIDVFNDVLGIHPKQTHAMDALARLYEQIGEWDKAVSVMSRLNELVEDATYRVSILFRLGMICEDHTGDVVGAEEYYSQVLAIDGSHVKAMTHLIALYKLRGDWAKAAGMMVEAESCSSNALEKARLLYEAGAVYLQQLDEEAQATEMFARCLQVDPDHQQAGEPLAQIYFRDSQWAELEPILDMLIRKADRRDNRALQDLYYRQGRTTDELGKQEKALKFYKAAYDFDPSHLETLTAMAGLLFQQEEWDRAFKLYQTILVHHRDRQRVEEIVDIYYRLGVIKLRLGERKKAQNMFEKALELDSAHRPTLESIIEIQTGLNDWEAVVNAKRGILQAADWEERFVLMEECGDIYMEKLQDIPKAVSFYHDALELKPQNPMMMHKLLEAYYESKQWKNAVDILGRRAALETDAGRRAKYYYTAAVIYRDEVRSIDEAIEYFNRALDDDADLLKAFEAIDKLGTQTKDWRRLERDYRRMLKRLPSDEKAELKVMLWHNLGEIYRTRLGDYKSAATAFEVAASMDKDNLGRHEILAELYTLCGPDYVSKAVTEHQILIKNSPFNFTSYKALRRIYMDAKQYDKAWCLCATLSFLKKADAEEQAFFEQYRQHGFVRAQARITDQLWQQNVFHLEQDRFISAILGTVAPVVAAMTSRPHKAFKLKRKDRRDLATDQLTFSKVFSYVTSVLGVVQAELYIRPERPAGLVMAHTNDIPSYIVGSELLQGRSEKELAFATAKQLANLRPEHFLRNVLGAPSQLKTVFFAALKLVDPKFPVPPADAPAVDKTIKYLSTKIHPAQAEQLTALVKKFAQRRAEVNLNKWWAASELTTNRTGLILCNDLEVAARMVSLEPASIGSMSAKEKVKDLVLFSISEDYFRVRGQLGMTIGT